MRYLKVFIVAVLFVTQLLGQDYYRKSWALIMGINEYESLPRLSGAVKSAKMVREKLVREFGFDPENVIELYDDQATRENILKAFDKLMDSRRVSREDRVLIYFAGHGVTRKVGGKEKGYIMPVDGVMDKFTSTAISTDQLNEFQEVIPAKHLFYVMDACYSGTIFTRGIGLKRESFVPKMEAILRYTGSKARVAITAGGRDEQVTDLADQGVSIFAYYFLRGLDGEADFDGDSIITGSELADYVARNVRFRAPQTPQYGKLPGDEGGEFIFVKVQAQPQVLEAKPDKEKVVVPTPSVEQKPKPVGKVIERKPKDKKSKEGTIIKPVTPASSWIYASVGFSENDHSRENFFSSPSSKSATGGVICVGFQQFVSRNLALSFNILLDGKSGAWKLKPREEISYIATEKVVIRYGPDVNYNVWLTYFVINPMIKLHSGGFYLTAGPAVGFASERKYEFKSDYVIKDDDSDSIYEAGTITEGGKISDVKTRFSLPVGVGYDLKFDNFKIFLEGRRDFGLNDVTKDSNWRISSLQLLVGVRLGL